MIPTFPARLSQKERLLKAVTMRRDIVTMTHAAGSGHPGGSLSAVELLVALFFEHLKHNPADPQWKERDFMIFCKCHITPTIYSILARSGYFSPEILLTFRKFGSPLQGHPYRFYPAGIEMSGGSLGQNLSIAGGVALGLKTQGKPNRVYALSSEGDLQEGQSWEAIMSAAHFRLDNLCLLVDYNKLQIDGYVEDVMGVHPLDEKFRSFNWHVLSVENGHDFNEINAAISSAKTLTGRPQVIIAHTVKGKGISFMENQAGWHGKAPNADECQKALIELAQQEELILQNDLVPASPISYTFKIKEKIPPYKV
ncbi:transketolase [Candidatus Peregrinibacteria bacterium]|nr:transketolase [Candidatus Peregrinibacteria bacterium]